MWLTSNRQQLADPVVQFCEPLVGLTGVLTRSFGGGHWTRDLLFSKDGKKLYVNKWAGDNMGGTWVFDINADGTLSNMNKFVDMGGDGMSMDEQGNIYISNSLGVVVFDPAGNKIMTIDTGGGATNNVFAGADEKTLFITGPVDKVTSIEMNVSGVEKF